MNEQLIKEIKEAIDLVKKDILIKEEELNNLIKQYQQLCDDNTEQNIFSSKDEDKY